ncbi:MAG: hypothetical protein WC600_02630 [Desulfobaccales bacterium]
MAIDLKALGVTEKEAETLIRRDKARKDKDRRNWTRQRLLIRKAKAAGIEVTDAEIDAELAKK